MENKTLTIIGCSAQKLSEPALAKDLYTGVIFKKSLNLANKIGGDVYILSGLHGLITLDTVIEPYEYGIEGPIFDQKFPKEQQPQKSRERRGRNKLKIVKLRDELIEQGINDEDYDVVYVGVSEYYLPALEGVVLNKPYKHFLKGGFGFFNLRGSFIDEQYDRLDMLPLGNHKSHTKWYKENKF